MIASTSHRKFYPSLGFHVSTFMLNRLFRIGLPSMKVLDVRNADGCNSWAERESEEATRFSPAGVERERRESVRLGLGPKKSVMSRRRPKSAQKEICIFQLKSERGMHCSELKEGTSRKFINSPIKMLKVMDSWKVEPTRPSWKRT